MCNKQNTSNLLLFHTESVIPNIQLILWFHAFHLDIHFKTTFPSFRRHALDFVHDLSGNLVVATANIVLTCHVALSADSSVMCSPCNKPDT